MAKKKTKSTDSEDQVNEDSNIVQMGHNDLIKQLRKKYGQESIVNADVILERKQQVIPITPKLDIGLNGGIPEGSWIILSGPPKCGKSSLALWIASICQKQENGNRNTYYLDAEGRLKKMNLLGTKGLQIDKVNVVQSSEGAIISAETFANIGTEIIKGDPGCVLIVDSTSAMCSDKELSEDVTGQTRALGPRIMANFCRKMGTVVPVQRTIVILIQHLIANTSGYGPAQYEDGGRKIQYQCDIKLRCKSFSKWEDTETSKQIGQNVTWDVITSALGPPGEVVVNNIRYNEGIDVAWEIMDLACDFSIIKKGGSWFSYVADDETEYRAQGQPKFKKILDENPLVYKEIHDKVRTMMGFDK